MYNIGYFSIKEKWVQKYSSAIFLAIRRTAFLTGLDNPDCIVSGIVLVWQTIILTLTEHKSCNSFKRFEEGT